MVEKVDVSEYTELIKANLTYSEESYEVGCGEGCWFFVTPEGKRAYDDDSEDWTGLGVLQNDSFYYEGLHVGEVLPLESRGRNRPVVPYRYLAERFRLA